MCEASVLAQFVPGARAARLNSEKSVASAKSGSRGSHHDTACRKNRDYIIRKDNDVLKQIEVKITYKGCKVHYQPATRMEEQGKTTQKNIRCEGTKARLGFTLPHMSDRMIVREFKDSKYDWMSLPQYQSTDESQWE
ncbi:hypothetical protein BU17DRAFT_65809 [Hysterangium stoloniferum]|nr:hypothetical protein BU17DRAFT_65809 [Hysterangium stoloniferum]